jgi:hypothetical protein
MKNFQEFFESKNYANLYHLLDFSKLKFAFENNKLVPYIASNGNAISLTRDKMMNYYEGGSYTNIFKLEIDGNKLSNNHKIRPYNYKPKMTSGKSYEDYLHEREELVKGTINNLDNYVTKLIINKSIIEKNKYSNGELTDFFTDAMKHNIPYIVKYALDNSPFPIYVQEGSKIYKDDEYLKSVANFNLKKVEFVYDVWYKGYLPHEKIKFAIKDYLYDNKGKLHSDWVIGQIFPGDYVTNKKIIKNNYNEKIIKGQKFEPYFMKFRKLDSGQLKLVDAKPLRLIKIEESVSNEKLYNYILLKIYNRLKKIFPKYVKLKYKIDNNSFTNSILIRNIRVDINKYNARIKNLLRSFQRKYLEQNIIIAFSVRLFYDNFNLDIYIKDLYTKRVNPPRYIYHATESHNVESVLKEGLKPMPFEKGNYAKMADLYYPPAIFASKTEDYYTFGSVILKIDTKGLDNIWWEDLNDVPNAYMTFKSIPPSHISLVKQ